MKLYELSEKYQKLQYQIEEGEIPEEAISDTLEGLEGELKIKADGIACVIKNLCSEAEMIMNEAKKQFDRAKTKLRKAQRMQEYLKEQLIKCDIAKIETPRNKIQIKKNPKRLEIFEGFTDWAQEKADHLLKYSAPEPNKTAIKAALQEGRKIPYVKMTKTERLEIK